MITLGQLRRLMETEFKNLPDSVPVIIPCQDMFKTNTYDLRAITELKVVRFPEEDGGTMIMLEKSDKDLDVELGLPLDRA